MTIVIAVILLSALAAAGVVVTLGSSQRTSGRTKLTAALNVFWGVITLVFFAPSGMFFALVANEESTLGALAVLMVSLSGFGLGVSLCTAAKRLLGGRELRRVSMTARWSIVHHLSVGAVFFLVWLSEGEAWWVVLVPCAFGWMLAAALKRSAR